MIRFENVSKSFGGITALNDISFEVKTGEFVFLTGASGAGKTTILRLILGEYLPDRGRIYFNKEDITHLSKRDIPKLRQQIGSVFQDFKVLPERTVAENVEVALAVTGVDQSEWQARIRNILKLVNLEKRARLFPQQLSGGELQRVSLARALVVNPKLILADEPTGNLDWKTAEGIMKLFESINKEGKTLIMATHHQGLIKHAKHRILNLEDGKLKEL
jgi:cell division transport system ATP-binding protein